MTKKKMMKKIRKKIKKILKSKINCRLIVSFKRLSFFFFLFFFLIGLNQAEKTNSFFSDAVVADDNSFSAGYWIPPQVEITSPVSGDEWQVGSSHNINWTIMLSDPSATIDGVELEYSCDNGITFHNIDNFASDPGNYNWTVPEEISDECQIKVVATDSHGLIGEEEGDNFEISWMVVLNEFVPDPILGDSLPKPGGEWVELYNNGSLDVDVAGWYLYDNNDSHELLISNSNGNNDNNPFDSGETIVPSGGHLVVFRNGDGDFALNNNGADAVRLYDGEISAGANLIDAYDYEIVSDSDVFDALNTRGNENMLMPGGIWDETWPGKSFARYPDGIGDWYDPVPTPGDNNSQSLEVDDFKDFFEEWCLDEDGDLIEDNPSCDTSLLIALGLLEDESSSAEAMANKKDETEEAADDADVPEIVDNKEKIIPETASSVVDLAIEETEVAIPPVSVVPVPAPPTPIVETDPIVVIKPIEEEEKILEDEKVTDEEKARLEAEAKAKEEELEKAIIEKEKLAAEEAKAREEELKLEAEVKAKAEAEEKEKSSSASSSAEVAADKEEEKVSSDEE